ncbi:MAG TPA: ABC transporter ATP-binding protein [Pseudolysinimonas sp.]|nr:ABC transporter ATP-binding protein [Pseudolysinimonas sp.]
MITTTMGAQLDVTGVSVRFSGVHVLNDVSFSADPGSIHALIGPNGAGKSTLFNVLSGIYRPVVGSVSIDDKEIVGLKPYRVARVGVGRAFQNNSMFESLTVEENLLLGRHRLMRSGVVRGGLRLPFARNEEREAREKVREIAEFLEVDHLLSHDAGDLSYGDAKRVDVARAVCTEPRLLLLDEPAAGVHTHEKIKMQQMITRIARELGTTILLVEHDMGVVMGTSDRITVLNFGTVLITGTPEEIRNDPKVIEAYLGHSTARSEVAKGTA